MLAATSKPRAKPTSRAWACIWVAAAGAAAGRGKVRSKTAEVRQDGMAGTVLHAVLVAQHLHDRRRAVPAQSFSRCAASQTRRSAPQPAAGQAQFERPGATQDHAPAKDAMALDLTVADVSAYNHRQRVWNAIQDYVQRRI